MIWRGRTVAVVGLGVSNLAVIRYLYRQGARIVGFDQKTAPELGDTYAELRRLGVKLVLGPEYLEHLPQKWDGVFLTPGMPKTAVQLQQLQEMGVPFYSEIGLMFSLCRGSIIGVTGSSGKTTTTTLIGEMLKQGERPVYVGGNIGVPLLEKVDDIESDAWVVLELSSFQLEMLDVSPPRAVITNISPNHLDFHGTMPAYVAAKRRIFQFQSVDDWTLLNGDDEKTRGMAADVLGHVATFSRFQGTQRGAYVQAGQIVVQTPALAAGRPVTVCSVEDIALPGMHNVENVLAAAAVAADCGIDAQSIRTVATSFTGVPHRLEFVAEWDGVRYYNDSIATSPARAVAGVKSFKEPIVLIAGGYDKQLPFTELAEALPGRVHSVVLLGATAGAIEEAIRKYAEERGTPLPRLHHARTLEAAVLKAKEIAQPGNVVLLSPACASYDMFPNFEARGRLFRDIVQTFGAARATAQA